MNLLEVRTQFVKITGRYDLVTDTSSWEDNGADFFLQAGQNMIEKLVGDQPETEGRLWETLASGAYYVNFQQRCRMIFEVWANDTSDRVELTRKSWQELKELYPSPLADIDRGYPLYYCIAKLREIDATDKNATGVFFNSSLPTSTGFRGIVIMPPVDAAYDIEVYGKFLQPELSGDSLENFWTLTYPEILIRAAMYQMELSYRGRQAVGKLLESLMLEITEIDKDAVEEATRNFNQIGG